MPPTVEQVPRDASEGPRVRKEWNPSCPDWAPIGAQTRGPPRPSSWGSRRPLSLAAGMQTVLPTQC